MNSGTLDGKIHRFPVRVYYEDTDQQGIVFYANYLKYFERARTEFLRHLGAPPAKIETELGRLFVVAKINLIYHRSACLDEVLEVQTQVARVGKVKLEMDQRITRGDTLITQTLITQAQVTVAIIDPCGRPARLTPELETLFATLV